MQSTTQAKKHAAKEASKKTGASDGWLLHGRFWHSLSGLVSDGIAFTTQPFRRSSGGPVAAGASGGGGGGSGLSSALLGGRPGGVEQSATEGALASRGAATGLHMAAALGQKAKLPARGRPVGHGHPRASELHHHQDSKCPSRRHYHSTPVCDTT